MRLLTVISAIFAMLIAHSSLAEDRYALIIGNEAYENIDPLRNPANDARLISNALESVGFDVTTIINADVEAMQDALNTFVTELDRAGENAVGVFYFAGHGVQYEGENWLIPVEANIQQAALIKYRTVSANLVLQLMEAARNSTNILILDACRNNPFRSFSLSGTRAVSRGLSIMDIAPTGSYIAYSTAPGQVAYDGLGAYSPFAEAFAGEITTSNETIGDMMIGVRVKVADMTVSMGGQPQIPWSNTSLMGRFWFNPGANAAQNAGLAQRQPLEGTDSTVSRDTSSANLSNDQGVAGVWRCNYSDRDTDGRTSIGSGTFTLTTMDGRNYQWQSREQYRISDGTVEEFFDSGGATLTGSELSYWVVAQDDTGNYTGKYRVDGDEMVLIYLSDDYGLSSYEGTCSR